CSCGGNFAAREPDQSSPANTELASIFHLADPRAASQAIEGFYAPESFGRWTRRAFSVLLRNATVSEPALIAKLYIPENEIARLHSLSLSASVGGVDLAPETYTSPGAQVYVRRLPERALRSDSVRVDFHLDKWLAPGALDDRELGIVLTVVGLKSGTS